MYYSTSFVNHHRSRHGPPFLQKREVIHHLTLASGGPYGIPVAHTHTHSQVTHSVTLTPARHPSSRQTDRQPRVGFGRTILNHPISHIAQDCISHLVARLPARDGCARVIRDIQLLFLLAICSLCVLYLLYRLPAQVLSRLRPACRSACAAINIRTIHLLTSPDYAYEIVYNSFGSRRFHSFSFCSSTTVIALPHINHPPWPGYSRKSTTGCSEPSGE